MKKCLMKVLIQSIVLQVSKHDLWSITQKCRRQNQKVSMHTGPVKVAKHATTTTTKWTKHTCTYTECGQNITRYENCDFSKTAVYFSAVFKVFIHCMFCTVVQNSVKVSLHLWSWCKAKEKVFFVLFQLNMAFASPQITLWYKIACWINLCGYVIISHFHSPLCWHCFFFSFSF